MPEEFSITSDHNETVIYSDSAAPKGLATHQSTHALNPGCVIAGHRIERTIGIGGFGVVYQATDLALGRTVALKEYFPHSLCKRSSTGQVFLKTNRDLETFQAGLKSFINEARLLAQFDHSSLIKVFQFWESNQTAYMTMNFVPGKTLKSRMEINPSSIPESKLIEILQKLAQALQVMHEHHCYHRDVAPDNVIMHAETDSPVLLDFGAARQAIESHAHQFTVILKSGYAPVEQYSEVPALSQGPWTDVYALGALAYKLITGQAPPSAIGRMMNDSIIRLAGSDQFANYSSQLLETVDDALAVMPEDRIQNMAEFLSRVNAPCAVQAHNQVPASRTMGLKMGFLGIIGLGVLLSSLSIWNSSLPDEPMPTQQSESNRSEEPLVSKSELATAQITLNPKRSTLLIDRDLLELEMVSDQSGYLYLFVQSSDGLLLQMLPSAATKVLSVQAGEKIRFPSKDEPLVAAGPPGTNEFMAVLTDQPIPEFAFPKQPYFNFSQVMWSGPNLLEKLENQLRNRLNCSDQNCTSVLGVTKTYVTETH